MRRSKCVHRIHLNAVEPTGVRGEQGSRSLLLRLNLLLLNLDLLLLMEEDARKERDTLLYLRRRMLRALCIPLGVRETICTDTPPTPVLQPDNVNYLPTLEKMNDVRGNHIFHRPNHQAGHQSVPCCLY